METREILNIVFSSQGNKCFDCGKVLTFETTYKRAHSFELVCLDCYKERGSQEYGVYDEEAKVDFDELILKLRGNCV